MDNSLPPPLAPQSSAAHSALRFLFGRIDYERLQSMPYHERHLKLDRMRRLLHGLGDPHLKVPAVHIAGTKGKGSTAVMIASVLSAAGYRTGLYTSPHLERLEERIVIDGRELNEAELAGLVARARPVVEAMDREAQANEPQDIGPTYFELTTALAMLHFAEQGADAAVLEVGLGGRLDSTNVCEPAVSVITSISRDHCRQLGESLDEIAREKAGIIRPGVPVVSGAIQPEARAAIRAVAELQGAPLSELGVDFHFNYQPPRDLQLADRPGRLDYWWGRSLGPKRAAWHAGCFGLELWLSGRHQAANAAVGLAVLAELVGRGWHIPEAAVRRGLAAARCAGRVEVVTRRPTVVVDTAHNAASVESLLAVLDESFRARRRLLLMAGTKEKDLREMLELLLPAFDQAVFTRYKSNPRAVEPDELVRLAREITGRIYPVQPDPAAAWQQVRALAGPDDLICVAGSFFLAGEIRGLLRGEAPVRWRE